MMSKPIPSMVLAFAAGAMAMENGRVCDPNDNMPFINVNPSCNFAGTCVEDGGSTYCACCELDKDTLQPVLVDGVPNCPSWLGGLYKGSTCSQQAKFVSNIWSYYIEKMACDRVPEFVDAANVAFKANGYMGKISLLHHRCESQFVLKAVEITLATDLNSHYDASCFNEETFGMSWSSQPPCLANPDNGYVAALTLRKILENEDEPEVPSIEQQMNIHIRERHQRALLQTEDSPSTGSEVVDGGEIIARCGDRCTFYMDVDGFAWRSGDDCACNEHLNLGLDGRASGTKITRLDPNVFKGATLSNIKHLTLSKNALTELPATLFSELTALEELDMVRNQLAKLPKDLFNGLVNLKTIKISDNLLSGLDAKIFNGLHLEHIEFERNKINYLDAEIFKPLHSTLQSINMGFNELTELSPTLFHGLTSLERVWLWDNQLSQLSLRQFQGLSALQDIDLTNNPLTTLPRDIFQGLPSLKEVYLELIDLTCLLNEMIDPSAFEIIHTIPDYKLQDMYLCDKAPPAPTTTSATPAPPTQTAPTPAPPSEAESCVIEGMRWKGKSAAKAVRVQSAAECNEHCEARRQCKGWTFDRNASLNQQNCVLSRKAVKSDMKRIAGVVSGKKACDPSA